VSAGETVALAPNSEEREWKTGKNPMHRRRKQKMKMKMKE
jgi:hypothetical protein